MPADSPPPGTVPIVTHSSIVRGALHGTGRPTTPEDAFSTLHCAMGHCHIALGQVAPNFQKFISYGYFASNARYTHTYDAYLFSRAFVAAACHFYPNDALYSGDSLHAFCRRPLHKTHATNSASYLQYGDFIVPHLNDHQLTTNQVARCVNVALAAIGFHMPDNIISDLNEVRTAFPNSFAELEAVPDASHPDPDRKFHPRTHIPTPNTRTTRRSTPSR